MNKRMSNQINEAFPLNIFDLYEIFTIHSIHISVKKSQILRLYS